MSEGVEEGGGGGGGGGGGKPVGASGNVTFFFLRLPVSKFASIRTKLSLGDIGIPDVSS